jgi:general secretion pathway protein A
MLAPPWARFGMAALLAAAVAGVVAMGWDARQRSTTLAAAPAASAGAGAASKSRAAAERRPASGALAALSPASAAAAAPLPASAAAALWPASDVWRNERDALRALAQAWQAGEGAAGAASAVPCTADAERALLCYRGTGTVALLRQLDRPALLALREADGSASWAVLSKLEGSVATLLLPEGTRRVALSALAGRWRGEFTTLFREPPGYPPATGDEARALSPWLAEQLDKVAPVAAPAPLKARVAAFQLAQGLQPDGRPGPMTYMQLNRALGVDEPRLVVTR